MRHLLRRGSRARSRGEPTYRNSAVIERLVTEQGVDQETAELWFAQMLRFLDMCADSDTPLAPSKSVDAAWHAFIVNTRDYDAYCRERFGRFLHHDPTGRPDPAAYGRAYELAERRQGPLDPAVWPIPLVAAGAHAGVDDDEEETRDDRPRCSGGSGCGGAFEGAHDTRGGEGAACTGASCGASCGGGGCGGGG